MAQKLKRLTATSVAFVDRGANQNADVVLFKSEVAPFENAVRVRLLGDVAKVDEDQRLAFGWASVVEVDGVALVDKQGDVISESDMEDMAYKFAKDYRDASEMHRRNGVGRMVESMAFTREKQRALGIDLKKSAWWVGFHVTDDPTWAGVKSGEYPMLSIEGFGERETIPEPLTLDGIGKSLAAVISKMGDSYATDGVAPAQMFDQVVAEMEAANAAHELHEAVCPLLRALRDSVHSIIDDPATTGKSSLIQQSADQFMAELKDAMVGKRTPEKPAGAAPEIKGASKMEITQEQFEALKADVAKATTTVETLTKALESEKARAGTAEAALKTANEELAKHAPAKSDMEKRLDSLPEEISKGLRAEMEEMRKRLDRADELEAVAKFEKVARDEYPNLPGKQNGRILKAIDGLPELEKAETLALFKGANEAYGQMFKERGSVHAGAHTAWAEITKRADDMVKAGQATDLNAAIVKVCDLNPDLANRYYEERPNRA